MKPELNLSRRQFLELSIATAAVLAVPKLGLAVSPETSPLADPEPGQTLLKLGAQETNLSLLESARMGWTPDGRLPFFTTQASKKRYFFSGGKNNATYLIETDGSKPLRDFITQGQVVKDSFYEALSPDPNSEYITHYVGITSVIQPNPENKDQIIAVYHGEKRENKDASSTYKASIGYATSQDAGLTWTNMGPLIEGDDVVEPGMAADGGPSGAGQPCAIYDPKDGYVKILYIDWAAGEKVTHPDQIYFARTRITPEFTLEPVEYLTTTSDFSPEPADLAPVIPASNQPNDYTALPDVSWNTKLNKWICIGESTYGFWVATSDNFTEWSTPQIFYDFTKRGGKSHDILKPGERWDSYPTLLDETQDSANITGAKAIFYHTTGNNLHPHQPVSLDAQIV